MGRKTFAVVLKCVTIYGLEEVCWLLKACKEFSTLKLLEITLIYGEKNSLIITEVRACFHEVMTPFRTSQVCCKVI